MKRQIKFRGISKSTGKYLYGDLVRNVQGDFAIIPPYEMNMERACNHFEVEEDSISQFTGKYDSRGEEIYEDDVADGFRYGILIHKIYLGNDK